MVPSHYLTQYWYGVKLTPRDKARWYFVQNVIIASKGIVFENVVYEFHPLCSGLNMLTGSLGCHFKTAIFNLVLLIGIFTLSNDNALRWMPWDLNDDESTLVQVMAWCRQATSQYLNQCWLSSMSPYGVTRPQWINCCKTFVNVKGVCGKSLVTSEFPSQRPVTRSFEIYIYIYLTNGWANNRDAGDLRRHCAHYDVIVMVFESWKMWKINAVPCRYGAGNLLRNPYNRHHIASVGIICEFPICSAPAIQYCFVGLKSDVCSASTIAVSCIITWYAWSCQNDPYCICL